ncbi:MAG: ABC transporter permease [Rhodocyclales bacterium GT-UBC]|nr:MAG: ABC transporter permease [Rhodocyclales bacterium GT-UBC]
MDRRQFLQSAAVACLIGPACLLSARAADNIVIGQSCPLSGVSAALGREFQRGANLWFNNLNKKGGIRGQRIELISLDDGYEPERAAKNTELLIGKHNAVALFGYVGTPTSNAARPLFEREGVPFVAPFTGAQSLRTADSTLIFNIRASYDEETDRLIRHFATVGQKRIGIAYQDDAYGKAGLEGLEAAARQHGATITARTTLVRNSTDVQAAAQALLKAGPVDALIIISSYAPTAALIKALRGAGYYASFATLSFVGSSALVDAMGKDAEGIIVCEVVPWGNEPVVGEFRKMLSQAEPETKPTHTALEGFIAAKAMSLALERSKSISRSELKSTLSQLKVDIGGFRVDFVDRQQKSRRFTDVVMLKKSGQVIS